ncbi:hypothetical protein [Actinomadura rayongensis]|uniref:Uncharacterized protein n=1 Tax=Actinomadura rayongensis TaxID=1429076 RepID=A0A6I4WEI8_9ACTN|nr:hypothetical protein [Actinomadura rayongensis]MXQ67290.1 hypothetical protein [Actinomadura rayongensis]
MAVTTERSAPGWVDVFLEDLAEHGYVARAARTAGVSCTVVARRGRRDPLFARALREAQGHAPESTAREVVFP